MMWRRSTASGSVQETSRGVDAFVREPGGELAQRSSSGARLMGSAVPPPVESLTVVVRVDRPRRTADGDRKRSRRDRDRAPDDGGECRCVGVRARRCCGDLPRGEWRWPLVPGAKPRRSCSGEKSPRFFSSWSTIRIIA